MRTNNNINFNMFTEKGNMLVNKKVNKLIKKGLKPADSYDFTFFKKHFSNVSKHKNGAEVFDTMVRDAITFKLSA